MKIEVTRRHPHKGRYREVGEVYDCPAKKARLLIMIKKAVEYTEPVKSRTYMTRDMQASRATPAAQKLAEDKGVNLDEIEGTGNQGSITKTDVENAIE